MCDYQEGIFHVKKIQGDYVMLQDILYGHTKWITTSSLMVGIVDSCLLKLWLGIGSEDNTVVKTLFVVNSGVILYIYTALS